MGHWTNSPDQQRIKKKNLRNTCAKGDNRGLMPPSRSICAIVHAILSSLKDKLVSPLKNKMQRIPTAPH